MKPLPSLQSSLLSFAVFSAPLLSASARSQTLAAAASPHPVLFTVKLDPSVSTPLGGRLLLFARRGKGTEDLNIQEFHPEDTWVAAAQVDHLLPGASVQIDADQQAFPMPFSQRPPGHWEIQAVLDTEHSYNYFGRQPQDWESAVLPYTAGAAASPVLILNHHPQPDARQEKALAAARLKIRPGEIEERLLPSPVLTQFWGRPRHLQAWVVLPPGYSDHPETHYPTVYWTHGFGGAAELNLLQAIAIRQHMLDRKTPPMIWVMLDEAIAEGTHEFVDSINDGPWGAALTTEAIPQLEATYQMDARPTGRFLTGHSSGGWATLQLQVNYPEIFGGAWATSPDSSDFHDWSGIDLYAPHANVYHAPDGTPRPIMRADGKVVATLEQFAKLEAVLGPYGGQMSSFDWVFSQKGASGAPMPMFNRVSGDVDPQVIAYWSEHYDLANLIERIWPAKASLLKGRIHLAVGTADTFYLDGSAHLLEARLKRLGADPSFTYVPGASHFDLSAHTPVPFTESIPAEMYQVARPGQSWKTERRGPL